MQYAAVSHAGLIRDHNEDAFRLPEGDCLKGARKRDLDRIGRLFVVCDGVGGARAGEVASRIAADETMRRFYRQVRYRSDPCELLPDIFQQANNVILDTGVAQPSCRGMASTIVAGLARKDCLVFAHCGDSRAYVFNGESLELVTNDHTPVWDMALDGLLTREEARTHPMNHVLHAALGFHIEPQVSVARLPRKAYSHCLLCTDGVTDMLPESVIQQTFRETPDPEACCNKLMDAALKAGGHDNATMIVVRL